MRRLAPLLLLTACTGLEFGRGNAFPCDFTLPPGVRDEACVPGDVCGSDNLCKRYIYEGPRFEGTPTLPSYGPGTSEGERLHPLVLDRPVTSVMAPVPRGDDRNAIVELDDGTRLAVGEGVVLERAPDVPAPPLTGFTGPVVRVQAYRPEGAAQLVVVLQSQAGDLAAEVFSTNGPGRARALGVRGGFRVLEAEGLGGASRGANAFVWNGASLGVLERRAPTDFAVEPLAEAGANILDVAAVTLARRQWLVLLENDGLELVERANRRVLADGGSVNEADAGVEYVAELVPLLNATGTLRTDPGARVIAAVREGVVGPTRADVLSTFQVNIGPAGPTLLPAWADCQPCREGQRVVLFSPSVLGGAPSVEVVCKGPRGAAVALRVVGSVALSPLDACVTEQLELPVPFARATANELPVSWDGTSSLLLGGKHGELWSGPSISELQPFFLERVPLDVTQAFVQGQPTVAALTDEYLAVLEPPLPTGQRNGFRRVSNVETGGSDDSALLGFVQGVYGWAVTNSGMLVRLNTGSTDAGELVSVSRGPTLIRDNFEPIRDSLGGQAYLDVDGGLGALYLVADDSLYFLPDPEAYLDGDSYVLTPELTPEPSVPIRSLALERTTLGTNGDDAARGYLVTSRNVYEWQLGGAPPRWSARPLQLSAGQPLEVWFDRPRSALGRVGFTDGTVFTLPGGYQLTEALPGTEEDTGGQVHDYENLGGWPVAYSDLGLFIAGWDFAGDRLQNRFPDGGVNRPMTWRRVTLPDGGQPWMADGEARDGRLFVTVDPTGKTYRLLVFLDDQVLQVATHQRR